MSGAYYVYSVQCSAVGRQAGTLAYRLEPVLVDPARLQLSELLLQLLLTLALLLSTGDVQLPLGFADRLHGLLVALLDSRRRCSLVSLEVDGGERTALLVALLAVALDGAKLGEVRGQA
jgi:hypothetical protein